MVGLGDGGGAAGRGAAWRVFGSSRSGATSRLAATRRAAPPTRSAFTDGRAASPNFDRDADFRREHSTARSAALHPEHEASPISAAARFRRDKHVATTPHVTLLPHFTERVRKTKVFFAAQRRRKRLVLRTLQWSARAKRPRRRSLSEPRVYSPCGNFSVASAVDSHRSRVRYISASAVDGVCSAR